MRKISWPQACRAESAATAYRIALEWVEKKCTREVRELLEEKIKEKEVTVIAYRKQRENERIADADEEYRRANVALEDEEIV